MINFLGNRNDAIIPYDLTYFNEVRIFLSVYVSYRVENLYLKRIKFS
jgi:hypothetical protein